MDEDDLIRKLSRLPFDELYIKFHRQPSSSIDGFFEQHGWTRAEFIDAMVQLELYRLEKNLKESKLTV